ncbi:MAG: transport system ATP-binding/permease protein [Thermoanaerobaculia bacterium]|jgi:pSer/pThr/pTyr-binding forkhead associated (FHA) protein|nr:transport system ATP-binding/permease protein [Thermoanaerobaculia bacterium]
MALRYHPRMPLIRCAKCGQAYDVPGVIAVRLPNSIATCACGEWLSGSKAALLARLGNPDGVKEVDLQPYKVNRAETPAATPSVDPHQAPTLGPPRSIRVIARGAHEAVNTVFTIGLHPLWIGRAGCHVELAEAELSIRHCSISMSGSTLVVRDADSHMGTFLDGQQIKEAVITEGMHLLRVGTALVSIEPTDEKGVTVEPIRFDVKAPLEEAELVHRITQRTAGQSASTRPVLICIGGPLNGQEFEIPTSGLVVGREGHVRVPDEFLSRRHFEVGPDPDGTVRVRDLGSRNGTYLNTLPAQNTKVQSGDEIRAGVNRFRIEHR